MGNSRVLRTSYMRRTHLKRQTKLSFHYDDGYKQNVRNGIGRKNSNREPYLRTKISNCERYTFLRRGNVRRGNKLYGNHVKRRTARKAK